MIRMNADDFYSVVRILDVRLFPENLDLVLDDHVEAKARQSGVNPMSKSYIDKVNAKRELYGLTPLTEAGISTDTSSMEFIEGILKEVIEVDTNS